MNADTDTSEGPMRLSGVGGVGLGNYCGRQRLDTKRRQGRSPCTRDVPHLREFGVFGVFSLNEINKLRVIKQGQNPAPPPSPY